MDRARKCHLDIPEGVYGDLPSLSAVNASLVLSTLRLGSSFALEVAPYLGRGGNCFWKEIEGSLALDLSQLNSTNTAGLNCWIASVLRCQQL